MRMRAEEQCKLALTDRDSEARYDIQKVWYPNRVHKIDNHEGPIDCLGD